MARQISADICIIGAGSGGLSVAAGAAQLGRKVVLIEKGEMGGDCLNYGCVPSKALIASARRAAAMREAHKVGLEAIEPEIDFARVMDRVREVIAEIAPHDSQERFESLGVTVIRERGAFSGPRTVQAGDHEVTAKHFVIATGSSPVVPPIPGLADAPYFTNETIFENRTKPRHLLVIGGGPIGVELAQAHRRLGAQATIIEADTLLNRENPEAVEVVRAQLKKDGVALREKLKATRIDRSGDAFQITLDDGAVVEGSHILVAVGRRANLSDLQLAKANIEIEAGRLKLDSRLRTTNKRIYAIGDAAGGAQFTHLAGDHASTFVRNVLFKAPAHRRDDLAPRVTYCTPELASIGLLEAEATNAGQKFSLARWSLSENDRAKAEADTDGFIKAVIGKDGRILGVTIVGEGAGDLIAPWALAIANRIKIRGFTNMIAAYPSRSEISKRAAGAYYTPALFSARTRKLIQLLSIFD